MITLDSIDLKPTLGCVGTTVKYSGTLEPGETVTMQYRLPGGAWKPTHPMTVNDISKEWCGSIFWLQKTTQYEVQVVHNGDGGTLLDSVFTMDDNPPIGTDYILVATNGSDITGDGTIENPYLTAGRACTDLAPGSTVLFRGGHYIQDEVIIPVSGESGNWITFMPYGDEEVTISGNNVTGLLFYALQKSFIRFKDIHFEDCIYPALYFSVSHDTITEGCTFKNCHQAYGIAHGDGFSSAYGAVSFKGRSLEVPLPERDNIIDYNHIVQDCYFEWDLGADDAGTPLHPKVTSGVGLWQALYGIIIRRNTFRCYHSEMLDGITTYPEDTEDAPNYLESCDAYENKVYGAADDGLQFEGGCKNARMWSNWIENSKIGIANCPVLVGPCYVFRNIVWNNSPVYDQKATKVGKQTTGYGRLYYYHNTFVMAAGWNNGITQTNDDIGNIVSRNNIIYNARYCIEFKNSINVACDFDYDCLWSYDEPGYPTDYFVKYGAYGADTLAEFQTKAGQEMNGISVADPGFVDMLSGDLRLAGGSPCLDKGEIITQINDENSPWPYNGSAPDLGAIESGMAAAPTAAFTAVPNSGNAPLTVQFQNLSSGAIDSYLWDFGDEESSTEVNPQHVFQNPGVFTVTLTVTGPGGSDSSSMPIEAIETHQLTISAGEGGTTNPAPGQYQESGTVTVTALPDSDYRFVGWEEDSTIISTDNPVGVVMNADRAITAVFEYVEPPPNEYVVTFVSLGGGVTQPTGEVTVVENDMLEINAYAYSGWKFDHWEGDISGIQNPISLPVNSNMSVVAVFVHQTSVMPVVAGMTALALILGIVRRK